MKTYHTPFPLFVGPDKVTVRSAFRHGAQTLVADCAPRNKGAVFIRGEQEANALLFAASPMMVSVLLQFLNSYPNNGSLVEASIRNLACNTLLEAGVQI